jgi:hypothetical protein
MTTASLCSIAFATAAMTKAFLISFKRGALGEGRCFAHQSFTRSALIVSFGPTMRLTA